MRDQITKSLSFIINHMAVGNMDSFLISKYSKGNIPANRLENTISGCNFIDYESHNSYEVAIALEGKNIIELEGCYYILNENQICIIDKNMTHRTGWLKSDTSGSSVLWIMTAELVTRLHTTFYNPEERNIIFGADIYNTNNCLINEIIEELEMQKEGFREAAARYLSAFLMLLLRKLSSEDSANMGDSWNMQIIHEVQLYIQSHLDTKPSLREISDKVALSPNYLSVLYKQVTGKNLSNYIHEIKIEEAKKLLLTTSLTLSSIAERLGYYDQFHFSKAFKENVGQSPHLYRNRI